MDSLQSSQDAQEHRSSPAPVCRVAAHRGTSGGLAEGALLMAPGFSAQTTQTLKSAHDPVVDMSSNCTEITVTELGFSAQTFN